jgi:CBS domain-containing protein
MDGVYWVCCLHGTVAALHELAKHGIRSAPVVLSASLEDDQADTYLGIVDANDILKALIEGAATQQLHAG